MKQQSPKEILKDISILATRTRFVFFSFFRYERCHYESELLCQRFQFSLHTANLWALKNAALSLEIFNHRPPCSRVNVIKPNLTRTQGQSHGSCYFFWLTQSLTHRRSSFALKVRKVIKIKIAVAKWKFSWFWNLFAIGSQNHENYFAPPLLATTGEKWVLRGKTCLRHKLLTKKYFFRFINSITVSK